MFLQGLSGRFAWIGIVLPISDYRYLTFFLSISDSIQLVNNIYFHLVAGTVYYSTITEIKNKILYVLVRTIQMRDYASAVQMVPMTHYTKSI